MLHFKTLGAHSGVRLRLRPGTGTFRASQNPSASSWNLCSTAHSVLTLRANPTRLFIGRFVQLHRKVTFCAHGSALNTLPISADNATAAGGDGDHARLAPWAG